MSRAIPQIDWSSPGFATATDVLGLVRIRSVFEDMRRAKWIKPIPNSTHKRTLFSKVEVLNAIARVEMGEFPKA